MLNKLNFEPKVIKDCISTIVNYLEERNKLIDKKEEKDKIKLIIQEIKKVNDFVTEDFFNLKNIIIYINNLSFYDKNEMVKNWQMKKHIPFSDEYYVFMVLEKEWNNVYNKSLENYEEEEAKFIADKRINDIFYYD